MSGIELRDEYIRMCKKAHGNWLLNLEPRPGDFMLFQEDLYICTTICGGHIEFISAAYGHPYHCGKKKETFVWIPRLDQVAGMLPAWWKWFRINEKWRGGTWFVTITWTMEGRRKFFLADTELEARFQAVMYARYNVQWDEIKKDWRAVRSCLETLKECSEWCQEKEVYETASDVLAKAKGEGA